MMISDINHQTHSRGGRPLEEHFLFSWSFSWAPAHQYRIAEENGADYSGEFELQRQDASLSAYTSLENPRMQQNHHHCHSVHCLVLLMFLISPVAVRPFLSVGFTSRWSLQARQDRRRLVSASTTSAAAFEIPGVCHTAFDLTLPEGKCLGLCMSLPSPGNLNDRHALTLEAIQGNLDHWIWGCLHPQEIQFAMEHRQSQVSSFLLGRLALRTALELPPHAPPILPNAQRRPLLPDGLAGSISHKIDKERNQIVGVALVNDCTSSINTDLYLGIDLEVSSRPNTLRLAKKVLMQEEIDALGGLSTISSEEEVILRFSLKEAIYKASHCILGQYVGMKEARVDPHDDGTATCRWYLDNHADDKIGKLTAHWMRLPDSNFFLSSASAQRKMI